ETTGTYIPPNGCIISYTGDNTELLSRLVPGRELSLQGISLPVIPDRYFTMEGPLVPIDKINSIRDANQVILYDQTYGESTKTNVWGIELTVVDSVVTNIADISDNKDIPSGSNSTIPENGVVLSVHVGSPYYKQLHDKVKPGDAIRVYAEDKLYNASKLSYAAYNPKTISDNPAAWDKAENKPYDGFRGPNQLIIYDSSYGESTGTNPYGYEVAVDSQGMITSTGGNNLAIPVGGYILSGHGESLQWLEKYASLGASVMINQEKKEVTVLLSPGSYLNRAAYSIKNAADSLQLAKQQYLDINYDKAAELIIKAEERFKSLEVQLSQGGYEGLTKAAKEIQGIADNAWYTTFESEKVENRAVWLRPRDTSIEQVKKRLDMLKELNINILYLEAYWGGYAIYPTGNGVLKQNPMFNGLDILEVYLKEAHARGMEVHAWVENFLAGPPVAESKPDWMAVSRKGETWYLENGATKYYFMNPANPEVREFLSGLYKNLIRKYNLDGIQFDYMRYSHSGDYTNDFGYDAYTRQLFSNYKGSDPIALKPGDPLWEEWCSFRTQLISSYAYRVISEVKSLKPQLKVSADVWPEYDETLVDIFQDPKAWVRNDYINNLIPMSYYLHEGPVVDDIMNSLEFSRGHSQITSGIATFNKVDPKVFLRQVNAIRSSNTKGISIFEFESLFSGNYDEVLKP
ncbi:MAG TPA: family 10 glycosylhydrolase, partial [Negativicutes bacterium]|nr:family 10 glycosylhydrolase [Negativicutes bacterium]